MTDSAQALLQKGQDHLDGAEITEAEAAFLQAAQLMPDDPEVHLGMARLKLIMGEPEAAMTWAQQAAALVENKAEANALIGSCHMQLDQLDEALGLLKRTNQWYPDHPLVLANLGKLYWRQNQFKEAKAFSLKALALGAEASEVEYDLGISCTGLGEYEEAVDHFVKAIEANPTFLPPYFRMSQMAQLLGMFDDTIELLNNGLLVMPDTVELHEELHILHMLKQDPKGAMGHALAAAEIRGFAMDYIRIGNTSLLLEDIDAAQVAYETAIDIDPQDAAGHINLGHLHRLKGEKEEALAKYRAVAELFPELHKPYLGYALTYMELDQDYRKARLCLMRAVELAPQSYDVLIHLASCSLALGELAEAEKFGKVAFGLADTPREQERAAEILQALSQETES